MTVRSLVLAGALAGAVAGCGGEASTDCAAPGHICTWAGIGERSFNGDGQDRLASSLYWPMDLDFAPDGRAYLLDWQNHRVRRVNEDGRLQTVIGSDLVGDGPADQSDRTEQGAPGTSVELNHPTDLTFLPDGTLVLAAWHNHKIRTYDPRSERVRVICGGDPGDDGDHGMALRARLNQPKAVALLPDGGLLISDARNARLRRMDRAASDARIVPEAGSGQRTFGGDGGEPLQASFFLQEANENPEPGGGIAVDAAGNVYVADTYNHRIRRIDATTRRVTTLAGTGQAGADGDGGPGTAARLNRPRDLEIGPDGKLYVADTDNHRVRVIDPATGVIDTVVGSGARGFGGDGGPARKASLDRPFGIAFDRDGHLYIADTFNGRIRQVVLP